MTSGRSDGIMAGGQAPGASPRLHAQVLALLRRRIREGALAPGTRLRESPLALELGLSRAPVRQALLALCEDGLVRRAEGRGFVVEPGSAAEAAGEHSAAPDLAPAQRPSWQPIYDAVEKAVAARIAIGGWRIVEVDLARHFGVSRTVAREVMARLHQRGLVKRDDKARWHAPALTAGYVSELYEMRWTLEPLALLKASATAPAELVAAMARHLDAATARAERLTGAELDALEAELHVAYLGHCGNATLIEALRLYQSLLVAHSFLYAAPTAEFASEPFLPEHRRVIARLAAGHAAEAAQALSEHLKAARERAIARLETLSARLTMPELPYLQPLP
jgi:DNA-binding GntR family transcriptional regulator